MGTQEPEGGAVLFAKTSPGLDPDEIPPELIAPVRPRKVSATSEPPPAPATPPALANTTPELSLEARVAPAPARGAEPEPAAPISPPSSEPRVAPSPAPEPVAPAEALPSVAIDASSVAAPSGEPAPPPVALSPAAPSVPEPAVAMPSPVPSPAPAAPSGEPAPPPVALSPAAPSVPEPAAPAVSIPPAPVAPSPAPAALAAPLPAPAAPSAPELSAPAALAAPSVPMLSPVSVAALPIAAPRSEVPEPITEPDARPALAVLPASAGDEAPAPMTAASPAPASAPESLLELPSFPGAFARSAAPAVPAPPSPNPPAPTPALTDPAVRSRAPSALRRPPSAPGDRPRFLRPVERGEPGRVIVGIDLGTTYSCAAIVEGGRARALPSRWGHPTVPSVVSFLESGQVLIGDQATRQAAVHPRRTVIGAKRLLGRPFDSPMVAAAREHFAYAIAEGPRGEAAVRIGEDVVTLEEVSAIILNEIRESASHQVEGRLNRAVITCPAFYTETQREAVRRAGELAGFYVERVLNEPTAAALHYGYGRGLDGRRVLVYDLGGGTFDVSLLQIRGEEYEVLANGGDTWLGGMDFDACVAELLVRALLEREKIDARTDEVALARLLAYAERAKRELSEHPSTTVQIDHLVVHPHAARSLSVVVKRAEVEAMWRPLVDQTLVILEDVLQRARLERKDIDDIILVGGQTRTPLVARRIEEVLGKAPRVAVHPDEAVALGAAQLGATLMGGVKNVKLIDVLPVSIGVALPGGRMKKIMLRDSKLPAVRSYRIHTTRDNQRDFEVMVFQGEDERVENNECLGVLRLDDLPKGPKGTVQIEVKLSLAEEGVLSLSANEPKSGKSVGAQFATGQTPDEIRRRLGLTKGPTSAEQGRMRMQRDRPKGVWGWLTNLLGGSRKGG